MVKALTIPSEHPAYQGHFPGTPVLPGVVLLDAVLQTLDAPMRHHWRIASAKFHRAVRPGEALLLDYETLANESIRFAVRTAGRLVASGLLVPASAPEDSPHGEQG
ncbi:MAG TPA: hypothetical protein VIY54_04215 [Steroidobacteraceae bacterium]